jgi:hypothetical protein
MKHCNGAGGLAIQSASPTICNDLGVCGEQIYGDQLAHQNLMVTLPEVELGKELSTIQFV